QADLGSKSGTLPHRSHEKRSLGCAAPERSNPQLPPVPLSALGDRFGWKTASLAMTRRAKSELHTTHSCHCEPTWRVIPVRCLTGPMKKGVWGVLPLSEAISICRRCLYLRWENATAGKPPASR